MRIPTGLSRLLAACACAALVTAVAGCGGSSPKTATGRGDELFHSLGCSSCHGADGQGGIGPRLQGLAGKSVKLEGGGTVTADSAYLHESIRDPQAKIVAGYGTTKMPDFDLKPRQVDDLVAYLESIGAGGG